MQTRLLEHLLNNNILSMEQYGFRTKLTTENATYKLTNEVVHAMNNKLIVGGIFFISKKLSIVLIMTYCYLNWKVIE
jgi:hypothetical protein